MTPTTQQIEHAWRVLEDGSALEEVRGCWERLTAIRRELDTAVFELARRIEQLRMEAARPPEDDNDSDVAGEEEKQ
jgi:hypothetical protein